MLPFLTRTFLLLVAAFGLGALGGRSTRPKSLSPKSGGRDQAPARPAVPPVTTAPTGFAAEAVAPTTAPVSDTDADISADPVTDSAMERETADLVTNTPVEAPASQPAFASYGSGFVAGATLSDAPSETTSSAVSAAEGTDPVPLAAPDIHGRTPTRDERRAMPEDPLDARHSDDPLDFRTVDYGNAKAAERTAAEAKFRDDGWTIPEGATLPPHGSLDESPAAFKSGGGSGAVFEAPENAGEGQENAGATLPLDELTEAGDIDSHSQKTSVSEPSPPTAREGEPDDLTRIQGIGPSLERLLFDNGIFRFDQIAAWTEAEMRWADDLSGFQGRVAREKWIEQAKEFEAR